MSQLVTGGIFAGYRIQRLLGEGGMGEVYLADHPNLPKSVALKIISSALAQNDLYRQYFAREADVAARISHDNVVQIFDRGEFDGLPWLSMQYVAGENLEVLLKRNGPLPPQDAVVLVEQVAAGLDALHEVDLLHRDIKPANIMASTTGGRPKAYITDFGIAKAKADQLGLTRADGFAGSYSYVAPEIYSGVQADHRADVYSLGVVLFELLTGQVPFQAPTVEGLVGQIMHRAPPHPSTMRYSIPSAIDAVLDKVLAKDPNQRYQSCRELAEAARQAVFKRIPDQTQPEDTQLVRPPYRITRTSWNAGQQTVVGPISTSGLSPALADRLTTLVVYSRFFDLQREMGSPEPSATYVTLTVEDGTGRRKDVGWSGAAPPQLHDLDLEISRLAPRGRRTGRLVAAGVGGVALLGLIVLAVVLLLPRPKPPTPLNVPAALTASSRAGVVDLTWQPVQQAQRYLIYRDDRELTTVTARTSFTDAPGDISQHSYQVVAIDKPDHTSGRSIPATASAGMRSLTPPEITLQNRLPQGLVTSCTPTLDGTRYYTDTHPNESVDLQCTVGFTQDNLPDGTVSVTVYATDSAYRTETTALQGGHPVSVQCANGVASGGTWSLGDSAPSLGDIACYLSTVNNSTYATLSWTYDSDRLELTVAGGAGGTAGDFKRLYSYWQAAPVALR